MLSYLHKCLGPSSLFPFRQQSLEKIGTSISSSETIKGADAFSLISSSFSTQTTRQAFVPTHFTSHILDLPRLKSHPRLYSTNVRCPLPRNEFHNRKKELHALGTVLKGEPQISVISGPINSGKTTLILHLLEGLSKTHPILHLDLRERSFSNVEELRSSLQESLGSWMDSCKRIFNQTTLKVTALGSDVQISSKDTAKKPPIEGLNDLFAAISKQLPTYSLLSGKQIPILFIDEANKLKSLMREDEGPKALSNMFEWFIKNTKQDSRFHVLLGTSDSFFHLWIEQQITASRFTSYVIGNLSLEEARNFWNEKILTRTNLLRDLPPPAFDDAYLACGGNVYLLKKYFAEYCESEGTLRPFDFSVVGAERATLVSALRKSKSADSPTSSETKLWSREDYLQIMKMLVTANNNFLSYEDLCSTFDERIVNALIEANILHLRPTEKFSFDIPGHGTRPILTSETPSSLLAMKTILADIEDGKLRPPGSRVP